ncbi:MAG: hypothetical protein Q9M17_04620 [Mariprofundus sp.]|nr:hypothetical protein [Mariprofundus sp.]
MNKMKFSFNMEDASQVFVGAFALAVPISFSEEAWRLGETLPLLDDPVTSIKRIIVITMPASMGAIIVDSFDKE